MKLPPDIVAAVHARYQRLVSSAEADGMKRIEAVEKIAAELRAEGFELSDLYEQVADLAVHDLDDKDRRAQPETLQYAADALTGDTILGRDDPILDKVCAVGDGLRKAYRYLDTDDLLAIIARKTDHAKAAAAAAATTATVVRQIVAAMLGQHAAHMGDLFT